MLPGLALKAGIQPGFMVTSKLKAESGDIDASVDVKDACNTVDFTIPIGISYEISNLVLDARYNCGVSKAIEDADSRNSVFMLTVGYKFRLYERLMYAGCHSCSFLFRAARRDFI